MQIDQSYTPLNSAIVVESNYNQPPVYNDVNTYQNSFIQQQYTQPQYNSPLEKFSKILEDIPDSDETWYITDNLNLTRKDESNEKNPEKILRNARIDKEGNLVVKRADWTN